MTALIVPTPEMLAAVLKAPKTAITPHFTVYELVSGLSTPSSTVADRDARWAARSKGLTLDVLVSLCALAQALEDVRALFGVPVYLTSGFRPGDPRQHGAGQAADIQVYGFSPLEVARRIREHVATSTVPLKFRQVIAETRDGDSDLSKPMVERGGEWVHVAVLGKGFGVTSNRWLRTGNGTTYSVL